VTGDIVKDRFVLDECLASSTASQVFRALDQRRAEAGDDDPWVVLKLVATVPGEESRAVRALRREAAISQGLEHPNLPWVRGIDHDGPHTFLCLAWLEGESLGTILDSRGHRPMTRLQALQIVEGIGHALSYLHGLGITHADVKPGNILVSPEGHATLLDLGVALRPDAAESGPVHGYTPEYASPEVLRGEVPTPADDLFSLACVAYRMLSGRRAFGDHNAREAAAAGMRPERPETLSPPQWRALDQALAYQRAGRQHDVQLFLAQLKGLREEFAAAADAVAAPESTSDAAAASPAPDPARDRARSPPRWWPAVAVMAVVAALAAVFLFRVPETAPLPPVETAAVPRETPAARPISRPGSPAGAAIAAQAPVPAPPAAAAVTAAPRPGPRASASASASPSTSPSPSNSPLPQVRPAPIDRTPPRVAPTTPVAAVPAPVARQAPLPVTPGSTSAVVPVAVASSPVAAPATGPTTGPTASPTVAPAPKGGVPDSSDGSPDSDARVPFSSLAVSRYVEPRYPRNAATRRVAGWVDVVFSVSAAGRAEEIRVIAADPPGVFDDAALAAVRRWRFDAAGSNALTAPVHSGIRMRFDPE
jgi:TonB family protein